MVEPLLKRDMENVSEPSGKRLRISTIEPVASKVHENELVRMKVFISISKPRIETKYQPRQVVDYYCCRRREWLGKAKIWRFHAQVNPLGLEMYQ